jgi:hypothetical protein
MSLKARAAFSSYSQPDSVDFGFVEQGEEYSQVLYVFMPSAEIMNNFITSVESNVAQMTGRLEWQKCEKRTSDDGNLFYLFSAKIVFETKCEAPDTGSEEVKVGIADGRILTVPVKWQLIRQAAVAPQILYIHTEAGRNVAQCEYNYRFAGELSTAHVKGAGIEILDTHRTSDRIIFTLKASGEFSDAKLIVENSSGQNYEILIRKIDN